MWFAHGCARLWCDMYYDFVLIEDGDFASSVVLFAETVADTVAQQRDRVMEHAGMALQDGGRTTQKWRTTNSTMTSQTRLFTRAGRAKKKRAPQRRRWRGPSMPCYDMRMEQGSIAIAIRNLEGEEGGINLMSTSGARCIGPRPCCRRRAAPGTMRVLPVPPRPRWLAPVPACLAEVPISAGPAVVVLGMAALAVDRRVKRHLVANKAPGRCSWQPSIS